MRRHIAYTRGLCNRYRYSNIASSPCWARWMASASLGVWLAMGFPEAGRFVEIFLATGCALHFATCGFCAEGWHKHDPAEFRFPTVTEACIAFFLSAFMA